MHSLEEIRTINLTMVVTYTSLGFKLVWNFMKL